MQRIARVAAALVAVAVVAGVSTAAGSFQAPVLVKDFGAGSAGANRPSEIVAMGSNVFFTETDGIHGVELWKSDGTTGGTVMVADINPGANGSDPQELTVVGSSLFFVADDGTHGPELWRSDGTAAGTALVKDINPGAAGSNAGGLIPVGNSLFFFASDGTHGNELWKTSGTAAGTMLVKDVAPGGDNGVGSDVDAAVNGTLYFYANDGVHGEELWKSNGSAAGTTMVKDICPTTCALNSHEDIAAVGSTIFFVADDGVHGVELWRTDGTAGGTSMVDDINPGAADGQPQELTNASGTLFFYAVAPSTGGELYVSNGTAATTHLTRDIFPGLNGSSVQDITAIGSSVFFRAIQGTGGGFQLWASDGTFGGTSEVATINPSFSASPDDLTNFGGTLVFQAQDGTHGTELWGSDGTSSGTVLIADLDPGSDGGDPGPFAVMGGNLYFPSDTDNTDVKLWRLAAPIPPPTITGFTPSGGARATVTVTGTNLTAATSVTLNGENVRFAVLSATRLNFVVPPDGSSGTIAVTTPGGTVTSAGSFTVAVQPAITSFAPASGPVGRPVTVTGTGLGGTVAVQLGGILTVPTSVTPTEVDFTVPPGAASGRIRILSTGGTATSAGTFTVTG